MINYRNEVAKQRHLKIVLDNKKAQLEHAERLGFPKYVESLESEIEEIEGELE